LDLPWFPAFVPAAGGLPEGDPLPPSAGLGGGAGSALGTDTSLPLFPIFSFDGPSLAAGLSLPQSIGEATALTIKATWRSRDSPLSSLLTADTVGGPTPPSMLGSGGTADTALDSLSPPQAGGGGEGRVSVTVLRRASLGGSAE
jgi:hypothetical protein